MSQLLKGRVSAVLGLMSRLKWRKPSRESRRQDSPLARAVQMDVQMPNCMSSRSAAGTSSPSADGGEPQYPLKSFSCPFLPSVAVPPSWIVGHLPLCKDQPLPLSWTRKTSLPNPPSASPLGMQLGHKRSPSSRKNEHRMLQSNLTRICWCLPASQQRQRKI